VNKILKLNTRDKNTLLKTPFMASLGPAAVARMLEIATVTNYESRDLLFRESEPAEYFYCVLNGYIRLYRLNKDGREADIRICGPGDVFAECLLAVGDRYRYNSQAAENATVARFELQKVRQLAEQEKDVTKAVIQCLSNYLQSTMDRIANDRLQTAPQRVAHYLLDHCPPEGSSASIRLPFQKSLLAGELGLAPEALSRAFSTLRRAGVTVRGRVIQIADVNALRQI
jgi:CRP-like cAMP-binding protein